MKDGIINIDSKRGDDFQFTSDKFMRDSYLWKIGNAITISFIVSRHEGQGNLSRLFQNILDKGFKVKVPIPFSRMKSILIKKGFQKTIEVADDLEPCEMWVKS